MHAASWIRRHQRCSRVGHYSVPSGPPIRPLLPERRRRRLRRSVAAVAELFSLSRAVAACSAIATLPRVCDHVGRVQERLGPRMLLENPSSSTTFAGSTMDEGAFLADVTLRTGCGLLLDVNNVWVSACNQGPDPNRVLDRLPRSVTGLIHLAGFATDTAAGGDTLLIDDHGSPVAAVVWALYRPAIEAIGARPTSIERDNDVPPLIELADEARRARAVMEAMMNTTTRATTRASAPRRA